MPCGICRQTGHNRTTCPMQNDSGSKVKIKNPKINLEKQTLNNEQYREKLKKMMDNRPEQYEIANECVQFLNEGKHISINAPEKSGKRQIMENTHLILNVNHGCGVDERPISIYITALNRKDTKPQHEEQETYGITSMTLNSNKSSELLGEIIKVLSEHTSKVYIHIDECDYGSGSSQSLSQLYLSPALKDYRDRIKFITYSATPQEVIYSEKVDEPEWKFLNFIPHESFFGPEKYIDRGLVFNPDKFFDKDERDFI